MPAPLQLTSKVQKDAVTAAAAEMFDIKFDGTTRTTLAAPHPLPRAYACGLLVGPSGSGKTSLLRRMCKSALLRPGRSGFSRGRATAEQSPY